MPFGHRKQRLLARGGGVRRHGNTMFHRFAANKSRAAPADGGRSPREQLAVLALCPFSGAAAAAAGVIPEDVALV
uniref:Uncharacterized protein n=1 Tax=Romanomermis culicivorax TaxID=13658 RepID=A0A915JXN1_ROMCU